MKIKKKVLVCIAFALTMFLTACRADDILVGRWRPLPPEGMQDAAIAGIYIPAERRTVGQVIEFYRNFTGAILVFTYGGDIHESTFVWRRSGGNLTMTFYSQESTSYYDLTEPYLSLTSQPLVSAFTNRPITPPVTTVLRRVTDETD